MDTEFAATIKTVRKLIEQSRYAECEAVISAAMFEHPHAAVPHNLMGLLYEQEGLHLQGMRHFRAAYALNPAYTPATQNLCSFGVLYRTGCPAYCEADCRAAETPAHQREGKPLCTL